MITKTKTGSDRLQYLDWLRGLGAVIMLHGHAWDSYLKDNLKAGTPFLLSQFLGGMPPAIFLFLTGVTLSFLMDSSERKGIAPWKRVKISFRRSGYLFFLAFAFRLQLWIFGLPAAWQDLFRVDILNCMGFAIAALSVMALFHTGQRVRYCAAAGLAIALLSPLVSQVPWSHVPWLIRNYIAPDYRSFGFFPWGAYLAFGVSAGSAIRLIPNTAIDRGMQWVAIVGGVAIFTAYYFANVPYSVYSKVEFWLDSPAQVLIKQGVTLLLLAMAFVWTRYAAPTGFSWVRQFGTTSLLVYWVHIELVYGRASRLVQGKLNEVETIAAAIFLILLMLLISVIKTNWTRVRAILAEFGWQIGSKLPNPERVSGD